MTVMHLHNITLADARQLLASVGYRESWTTEELLAAVPPSLRKDVGAALRVSAAAACAEANDLERMKQ